MPLESQVAGEVVHGGLLFGLFPLAPPPSPAPNQNERLIINAGDRRRRWDGTSALEPRRAAGKPRTGRVMSWSFRVGASV